MDVHDVVGYLETAGLLLHAMEVGTDLVSQYREMLWRRIMDWMNGRNGKDRR